MGETDLFLSKMTHEFFEEINWIVECNYLHNIFKVESANIIKFLRCTFTKERDVRTRGNPIIPIMMKIGKIWMRDKLMNNYYDYYDDDDVVFVGMGFVASEQSLLLSEINDNIVAHAKSFGLMYVAILRVRSQWSLADHIGTKVDFRVNGKLLHRGVVCTEKISLVR
jgi:hypothetical protein